jgi:hypothetical protein
MCVDCVLASQRITQVDPDDKPLPEVVLLEISLAERSRSIFALVVFCVQVRNCFLFPVMPMRVVRVKSKPMSVGLCTGILRLRAPMDDILF